MAQTQSPIPLEMISQLAELMAASTLTYGFAPSPFGTCLIATSDNELCWLSFVDAGTESVSLAHFSKRFATFNLVQNDKKIMRLAQNIFEKGKAAPLTLHGTPFQLTVWNALLEIPYGSTVSYEAVAQMIGQPTAIRAVASAIAKNPVSVLVPCHRVVPKSGGIGNYAWGAERKKALIEWEQ